MEAWRRHFEKISNEEFGWNRNLPEIDKSKKLKWGEGYNFGGNEECC